MQKYECMKIVSYSTTATCYNKGKNMYMDV